MIDRDELNAYVDGELGAEQRQAVEARLAECCQSKAEVASLVYLKKTLSRCEEHTCAETWSRCCGRLDEIDRANKVQGFIGRYAWGFCGGLFLLIAGAAVMNRANGPDLQTSDLPRLASSFSPILAPIPANQDGQKRWVDEALSQPSPLKTEQFHIVGGSVGRVPTGERATALYAQDSQGPLTLMVIARRMRLDTEPVQGMVDFQKSSINGTNIVTWQEGQHTFVLMGTRDCQSLCQIAEAIAN